MKNGRANGHDDPKVASLEAARKAVAKKQRAERWARLNLKELLVGLGLVGLAVYAVVYWLMGLLGGRAVTP